MDPFTQRMLERARARQEKIDQKLANSGQTVPKRKPLTENALGFKKAVEGSPVKTPTKTLKDNVKTGSPLKSTSRRSSIKNDVLSPQKRDVVVTKKQFGTPKRSNSSRKSDVSVEINIMHRDDIQIEVQVEEREAPLSIQNEVGSSVVVTKSKDETPKKVKKIEESSGEDHKSVLRKNVKSRLDRLGVLYSDKSELSSPIHRTEQEFSSATPPSNPEPVQTQKPEGRKGKKFGRLAALADEINNWEDDPSHHNFHPESTKKAVKSEKKEETSALDVSIHSLQDINKALHTNNASKTSRKAVNTSTFTKNTPSGGLQLEKDIVAELKEDNANEADSCKQTREQEEGAKEQVIGKSSPVVRRMVPKLNGNADRSSVLSKAAMFEAGSPKAKDPAEMSLRERKALFEKNKGAAIVPKAPFGQAPSVKTLLGDKESKPVHVRPLTHTTPTKSNSSSSSKANSKENIDDNVSQTSIGGGIKDKLAALFSKERTISEATISSKFKLEREKEMEMLQSRFHTSKDIKANTMDSDNEDDHSEKAPLMGGGSALSLNQINKKPEIIANIPKVTFDESKCRSETALHDREAEDEVDRVVGSQPVKRRSSQDSPQVLAVLDDVKRIRVNTDKKNGNGSLPQPSIYPHLSDIETDVSQSPDENSDCGSSTGANDRMNKSDNWAETSFGREVMKVVKKNNSSYNKAIKDKDYCDSSNSIDSELEDVLDEALNDDDSEGPTPPKLHKNRNSLSSKSFTFKEGSPAKKEFKSPLKVNNAPARNNDRGNELVHSVSFYRRMQNASSQPTTPIRVIRHTSPDREVPSTPEQATSVTTVRERIKQLQNEIFKQQNIISQASQALNLCADTIEFSGSTEQAEGERLLLLATHRRQACLHEVQRLQVEGAGEAGRAGCASLQLGGIKLPLKRDYMRKLNADGAVGHHAVCLLKCRDRVLATSMQLTQPTGNVLHFPDHINMDGLTSDFKVTVEVYLLQASKEMLPHDVKYHISNKKSSKLLTPKSKAKSELKAPKIQSPAGPLSVRSPQFQAHGYCIFALPQADRKTFTLNKVPCGSPLEGSAHIEIAARVKVPAPAPHNAFLTAFDDVSGLGAWHRRWFVLQPPRLTYWKYPDDVQKKMPIGDIDLQSVISETATRAPRDLCARPNTILLESSVPPGLIVPDSGSLVYVKRGDGTVVRRHLLAADTPADRDVWIEALNTALEFVRCSSTDDD